MTATAAMAKAAPYYDGQGDQLGPIATFGAQFFIVMAPLFSFGVLGSDVLPGLTGVGLLGGAVGLLLLAPRTVLHRLPVSLVAVAFVGWILVSATWSGNPEATSFAIKRVVPIAAGYMIVVGVISFRHLVQALLWSVRITVVVTLGAVVALAEARVHIDPTGGSPDLAGWHGLFPHKNIMTPLLVFGLLTILTFDRTSLVKWASLALIGVLLVGSDSVTGMSSALLAVSIWVWLQLYQNLDLRGSSVFVVSTLSVGLFTLLGILASLSTITSASGKDLTFTGRTFIWAASLNAWNERPLVGWGLDGILAPEPVTARTVQAWREIGFIAPHSHNGFLDLGVQLGLVGVLLFFALFIPTIISGFSLVRERPKIGAWVVSVGVVQVYMALSEPVLIGFGWLGVVMVLRLVTLRRHGMELSTGVQLADRVRHGARWWPA